jgi:hypothetical protein
MGAKGAAPEGSLAAPSSGSGYGINGNAPSLPDAIAPVIRERLASYGIITLTDWQDLGRKRFKIFGITRAMVAEIDAIARRKAP